MEHWLSVVITVLLVLLDLAIRVFSIIYVPINRKPQTATAWLLAIFLIPYIGFIVFLVIGSTKLPAPVARSRPRSTRTSWSRPMASSGSAVTTRGPRGSRASRG